MTDVIPVDASGDQIVLASGAVTLTVVTVGGGMRDLTFGGWHVLDGYSADEVAPGASGQPLIPWPNRIAEGRYEFGGRAHQVPITELDRNNALHGFTRWMTWDIADRDASTLRLALLLYPRQGYPFALRNEIRYSVTPTGVNVAVSATNVGRTALPYANGFHPYLSLGTRSIDECLLTVPATTWLPTDERKIPVARRPVEESEHDFRAPRQIGTTALDVTFTDLARDGDGMARVRLADADGRRHITVRLDAAYRYLQVFSGDTLDDRARRRRSLAVEPMTAAPNAFRSHDGLRVLQPAQTFVAEWGIEL